MSIASEKMAAARALIAAQDPMAERLQSLARGNVVWGTAVKQGLYRASRTNCETDVTTSCGPWRTLRIEAVLDCENDAQSY